LYQIPNAETLVNQKASYLHNEKCIKLRNVHFLLCKSGAFSVCLAAAPSRPMEKISVGRSKNSVGRDESPYG
jgi:hypothetical protein